MRQVVIQRTFEGWRAAARLLLRERVSPDEVLWADEAADTPLLPGLGAGTAPSARAAGGAAPAVPVPPEFISLAGTVACHRDPNRWALLYQALWRIARGRRGLLEDAADDDVLPLRAMEKNVRFDRHKMTAFVRFREVNGADGPHHVAWYRPDHFIVRAAAPFFARRFAAMRWSILTPDECAHWDGGALSFSPGVLAAGAPAADDWEDLWRAYYASTFNPARVKVRAMKKEMPVRFWGLLPEARDIPDLLRDAPRRVRLMVDEAPRDFAGAGAFLPPGGGAPSLEVLRAAAGGCRGCPLCGPATRTVFGEGPAGARAVVVGEQPGDEEDRAGRPFVGPAGRVLDEALASAGIDRSALYVTNAVKHFKFEPRGDRRIHARPGAREVAACAPWLGAEISAIRPRLILCLGVTAAQALIGREFRMGRDRGKVYTGLPHAPRVMATLHPSALLRIPDPGRRRETEAQFLADLRAFRAALAEAEGEGATGPGLPAPHLPPPPCRPTPGRP